ncbi:MAG TPA: hypothetical protein VFI20_01620 [Terracidiphilus sp.]|nr:hypothetical protein [Terracidiphilus sp.]
MIFSRGPLSAGLHPLVVSRREFLRLSSACATSSALAPSLPLHALTGSSRRKVVIVTFGGGARDEETFAPYGQENIPGLMKTLLPQSTFFGQVINHGILGHYVATTSLATGIYETFNNFSGVPSPNPTIFEYFRKGLKRPQSDAWLVSPSSGFRNMGCGTHRGFGARYGAGVLLPKQLLDAAAPRRDGYDFDNLLRDTYEEPKIAAGTPQAESELEQLERILHLSPGDYKRQAAGMQSADELSTYVALRLMTQSSPSLLWITLHDIDVAHSGAYSLYIDGIQRTDRLCTEIWQHIQTNPEYAGRTTMFVLPDFGRDSDTNPSGNGFQHHRTGDIASRTTWMMALGHGVREGVFIERPVDSLDLVPTVGRLLGFPTPLAQGVVLPEVA